LDKLILHQAGAVAQKRLARGLKLNYVEAIALIAAQLQEFIRDGESVAALMNKGKQILGYHDVMDGVAELVHEVQVEGTFPDGTKLVTVHHPICSEHGSMELALYGSGLTSAGAKYSPDNLCSTAPGETLVEDGTIELNHGRDAVTLTVTNLGDRPIQVGSHYPFMETNASLQFDREQAYARRLDIPAGTAVRFEPGEEKTVSLVKIAGEQILRGGNNLGEGVASDKGRAAAMIQVEKHGFKHMGANS
jgi:urease subunit gamma/beta